MIRFFVFCFFPVFIFAEENKCTTEEPLKEQKRLCFFALNGPEESKHIDSEQEDLNCIQADSGENIRCGEAQGGEGGETAVGLEVQEFYADVKRGQSVSQAFEEMTKTRCDGLVISGHHVGYYTGDKTSQERDAQGNRSADQSALNLKFLEKLSCLNSTEDDSDCKKWFSNIKYVHLHGSHTSGHQVLQTENKSSVDDLALSRMKKYRPDVWTNASARYLNREYASTVDENNSLSGRYLKMFPSAQIYSWAVAPTIDQGSPETFIEHLKLITTHTNIAGEQGEQTPEESTKILENILNTLNAELDPKCVKLTSGGSAEEVILTSSAEDVGLNRKIGCDFSNAVEGGNKDTIITALDQVLANGDLHQNLNRIFYALNYDSPLSAEIKTAIRDKLKSSEGFKTTLEGQVGHEKIGVVKRADALYLYKQIYPDDYSSGSLEGSFVTNLLSLYDQQGDDAVGTAMKGMIAELIWKNNLGNSSAGQQNMTTLISKLDGENDIRLKQHAELMRISSGLYKADESKVNEVFEKLFELEESESDEFRDSQYFIKLWTDLQAQNTEDFTPVQEMYNSALKAVQEESDPEKKEGLIRKFANIVFGVGTGFAVRKEECLKDEFPLKPEQLEVADESRQDMVSIWQDFCG